MPDGRNFAGLTSWQEQYWACRRKSVRFRMLQGLTASLISFFTWWNSENKMFILPILPTELDTAMFCCTGSEANELALRIASSVTGGEGLVVVDYAYHGNSRATFEISPSDIPADDIPSYVVTVPAPDTFRGQYRGGGCSR
jgi:hypothetical protein